LVGVEDTGEGGRSSMESIISIGLLIFAGILTLILFTRVLFSGIGLEKFFPLILIIGLLIIVPLLILGKISESTFATFIGVIIGAVVTAFTKVIDKITSDRK
jgi:hypothetical protein